MAWQAEDKQHLSSLVAVGAERLKLLGEHGKLLMEGYVTGAINPAEIPERTLRKLMAARVLYQAEGSHELKLRHPVTQLIAALVTDESRRAIHADIADKLVSIRGFVEGLQEAQRTGDSLRADRQMLRIDEAVHDLTAQFEEAIFSLWHRLNSNFGFVSNLSDKIRENSRAQQQITRLIAGLSLIDFDEMIELAQGNPQLRKILVSRFQQHMSAHHGSLLEVQKRLVELMSRFREQQERSLLVVNMAAFLRENPGFVIGDYSYRSQVPRLVNCAAGIAPAAAVALDKRAEQAELAALVHSLYSELALSAPSDANRPSAAAVSLAAQQQAVEARLQQLKDDALQYYVHAVEQPEPMSALAFLAAQELTWPPEVWLFQILAEYNGLPRDEQRWFVLQRDEAMLSKFNQVKIIADLQVRYQPA